jgi:hypothetical protein
MYLKNHLYSLLLSIHPLRADDRASSLPQPRLQRFELVEDGGCNDQALIFPSFITFYAAG